MTDKEAKEIEIRAYEYELLLDNHQKAMEEFRKLSAYNSHDNDDDLHPLLFAAEAYDLGVYLPINHEAAKELYELAIKRGSTYALVKLADLYFCDGNYIKSKELYEQAISSGYKYANLSLGNIYENGLGVETDYGKALNCYRAAEKAGCDTAKIQIADMYFYGHGVEQSYDKAFEIYKQAYVDECQKREKTNSKACFATMKYAYMLKYGYGCKADPTRAMQVLKQADHPYIDALMLVYNE